MNASMRRSSWWTLPCGMVLGAWTIVATAQPAQPTQSSQPSQRAQPAQPPQQSRPAQQGQQEGDALSSRGEVPIEQLIGIVSAKTGDSFILDPRIRAMVTMIGLEPEDVDYATLLSVLAVHGAVALRSGEHVLVVPDANARILATPVVDDVSTFSSHEIVTSVIPLRALTGAQLVPILRPMQPQFAHLAPTQCPNTLVITDTAANVAKIAALVSRLDSGAPTADEDCADAPSAGPDRPRAAVPRG